MNPLTWMRENQHKMLVFFTAMLMAGFTALTVISSSIDRGTRVVPLEAKPVVSWKMGTTSDLELENIWRRRLALQAFLNRLLQETQKLDANWSPTESMILGNVSSADAPLQTRQIESFNSVLMMQKAIDMGVQVSDDTIDAKLARFTNNTLSRNDMRAIATEVGRSMNSMSFTDFREALKREFLAMQTFVVGIENAVPTTANPVAAFQYHGRMTRQYECQVLGLSVEDYLAKVVEIPSDNELKKLFAEGRFRYPSFDGLRPGFKIGNRLKLEYFSADLTSLAKKFESELTDEEVQAEYDRLVAEKDPLVYTPARPMPEIDPLSFPFGLGTDPPALEGPKVDPIDLDLPPLVPPVTGETPPKTETSGDKVGEEKAGDDKSSDDKSSDDGAAVGSKPASERNWVFVSVDIQDESQQPSAQEGGNAGSQVAETQAAEVQETQAAEVQETQAAEVQETQAAEVQETQAAGTEATQQAAEQGDPPATPTPPTASNEPQIRPLDEVRSEIRNRLAIPQAIREIEKAFEDITKKIRVFRSDFRIHQANPGTEAAPTPIDYQALAKQYNLIFTASPVLDQPTLAKTELGRVGGPDRSFADALFINFEQISQDLYVAQQINDETLVWVTETFPARVAEFAEVREQVLQFWQMNKARELALADATSMAAKVGAGQSLKEVFPSATETGAFTWFTMDFMRGGVNLSNVRGTERIGEEFMEVATTLPINQVGAAFNSDRSVVYVVQKTAEGAVPDAELVTQFFRSVDSFRDYPFQVGALSRQREFQAGTKFIENLRDEYNVNFLD